MVRGGSGGGGEGSCGVWSAGGRVVVVCEVNSLYKFQNFFASFASDETRQCAQEATTQAVQIQVQTVAYLGGAQPPPPPRAPSESPKTFFDEIHC